MPSLKNGWLGDSPMLDKSATTVSPVLGGFVPAANVTVSLDDSPGNIETGFASPTPDGFVEASTLSEIEPEPVRESGLVSVIVNGSDLSPPVVPSATVALNEKTLSPAVTSPFVPLSKNCCMPLPPIALKSAVTVCATLAGFVPGVTATVSNVEPVGATEAGFALPMPLGLVETAVSPTPRIETLSIASAGALVVTLPVLTE